MTLKQNGGDTVWTPVYVKKPSESGDANSGSMSVEELSNLDLDAIEFLGQWTHAANDEPWLGVLRSIKTY